MRKPLAVLAAFGLTAAGLVGSSPASAAVDCTFNNFSPRSVAVGFSQVSTHFSVSLSSGGDSTPWTLQGETFNANNQSQSFVFSVPAHNSAARAQNVVGQAYVKGGGSTVERTFDNGFTLKRKTGFDQSSLTDVTSGTTVHGTVSARLRVANWSTHHYVAFTKRTVALEFQKAGVAGWHHVTTATTNSKGYAKASYSTHVEGYYRFRYGGNSYAGASTMYPVHVDAPTVH